MNLTEKGRTGQGFERRVPEPGEAPPTTLSLWDRQTYRSARDNPSPTTRPGSDHKQHRTKGNPT